MVFSSAIFLFAFFPVVLTGYHLIKETLKNYWLLGASLIFYAWERPRFLLILLASISINFLFALWIDKAPYRKSGYGIDQRKALLILAIFLDLALLFYFKYFNFSVHILRQLTGWELAIDEVVLPVGISFFTFQGLSYVVDVYRGDTPVQKDPCKLAMYISMFPQLVAGPIVRYRDIENQIGRREVTMDGLTHGISRFIRGLARKVIVADSLAVVVDTVFGMDMQYRSAPVAWLGILAYALQIYFDFAGYSDMAIGMGEMFGFHFMENFDHPYMATSVTEFWRRWHISLSTFFRDYVYIPLGGNRRKVYRNVAIVFLLTGIWHGAAYTFIFWGIWHGIFNILERALSRTVRESREGGSPGRLWLSAVCSHVYTLAVVLIGWVFFRAAGLRDALGYLASMLGSIEGCQPIYSLRYFLDPWTTMVLVLAIAASTPYPGRLCRYVAERTDERIGLPIRYGALLSLLFCCILRIASGTYSAFIYFQF